ncbi:aminomethyl transferase family protein [Pseudomonas sp. 13B_2.1_Bac1]|uniref:aminomethyl transferase family protein n=1 Tax=Pseudomonas sp. 13B_2.1_Bac1 TaxID=2971624 RepID=UPI0021C7E9A0|nr:aminomethyl transferase family protein [Pseudomonas sp. 13B_2.1_Bac1]MCU1785190.1 aminomethyl transferase family protein [Pseudomonas sp. 13B_2.1_Bac1]
MQNNNNNLPLTPAVPVAASAYTYTRFGASFEAAEFTGWIDESMSWKKTCYIGDWSPLGKLRVKGPDALKFFSDLSINSFATFDIGQAKHAVFCSSAGKVIGDGVLMKLAEDDFLYTSGPGILWALYKFQHGNYNATLENLSAERFILQVQGPNALFVMEQVTAENLRDIGFMRFRPTRIGNREFLALRQGMAGEVGYELHGRIEDAQDIYRAILEAGQAYGIRQLGGRTKMVNHVEACFPTPTVDYIPAISGEAEKGFLAFMTQASPAMLSLLQHAGTYPVDSSEALHRSPIELGWGKSIKLDHDFIGRQALEAELAAPKRKMVTLVWNSGDVIDVYASLFRQGIPNDYMELPRELLGCMETDRVEHQGRLVGATSSRCYSYYFREMLSLCVIDIELAEPGTEVTVVYGGARGAQKHIRARVAAAPYKTDKRRADVSTLQPAPAR